jgi:hypothetical protein
MVWHLPGHLLFLAARERCDEKQLLLAALQTEKTRRCADKQVLPGFHWLKRLPKTVLRGEMRRKCFVAKRRINYNLG